jgi:hypothetical protein
MEVVEVALEKVEVGALCRRERYVFVQFKTFLIILRKMKTKSSMNRGYVPLLFR